MSKLACSSLELTHKADEQLSGQLGELSADHGIGATSSGTLVKDPAGYRHISSEVSTSTSTCRGESSEVAALLGRSFVLGMLCFDSGSSEGLFDGRPGRRAAQGAFRAYQKVLIDLDRRPLWDAHSISIGYVHIC